VGVSRGPDAVIRHIFGKVREGVFPWREERGMADAMFAR
jgi:predicted RNase H-like nuclease